MSFFHLFSGKPVAKRHRWAKKSVSKPQLQTFILDAIETPSAILDSPDAHQDSGSVALVDHPIADLQWQGVDSTHALDSSETEPVDTHGLPVSETVVAPDVEHISSDQIEPLSFMDGYGYGQDAGYGYGQDSGYGYGYDGGEVVISDGSTPGDHPATTPVSEDDVDPLPITSGQGYGDETTAPIAAPVVAVHESPHPPTEFPATPEQSAPPEASGSPAVVSEPSVPASTAPAHPIAPPPALGRADLPLDRPPLIGVIDTGFAAHASKIDYSHVSLGHDYVDGDANPLLEQGQGNTHGSHILDIITTHASNPTGSSPDLWLGRAIGSGHWADSLNEFVDEAKASGHTHAVVNLSFDLTQINPDGSVSTRYELTEQEWGAISHAQQNGVLIVAASGNQGGAISALGQAGFDNILTVGAAEGGDRAHYSSFGSGLDLLAPGSVTEAGVGAITGTSAAAAAVTGAVSQVWAANPGLSYQQVINILQSTATDLQASGWDAGTGAGLLNVIAAVGLARMTTPEVNLPTPLISPLNWWMADSGSFSERAAEADDESNPPEGSGSDSEGSEGSGSEGEAGSSGASEGSGSSESEGSDNQESSGDNDDSSNNETENSDPTDTSSLPDESGDTSGETSGNGYGTEGAGYGNEGSGYGNEGSGYGDEAENNSSSSSSSSNYVYEEDEYGSYTLSSSSTISESRNDVGEASAYHYSSGSVSTSTTTSIARETQTESHTSTEFYTSEQLYSSEGYGYGNDTDINQQSYSNHLYQNDGYHSEDITTHRNYEEQQENTSFSRSIHKDGSLISTFYEGSGSITSQLNQQTLYSGETTGSGYLEQSTSNQQYQLSTSSGDFSTSTLRWQDESITTSGSELNYSDGLETQDIDYSFDASMGQSTVITDGLSQSELNQTGLAYSYSRTTQNGLEQWVLEISRRIGQLTDNFSLGKVWSWIKTGSFTATGESSWTETLTQYSSENGSEINQTSVINGVPDVESRDELERGDELAVDLLNFIRQHEDTQDLLNSENLSYSTKLGMILDETIALLEDDDKAQLQSQREAILAIGQLVDAGGFHAALDSSLGGLYSEALLAQSTFDTQLFARDFKWFVKRDEDDLPLKVIVFPTKLLAAVKATPALAGQLENPEFVAALMDLGKAYGAIEPNAPVDPEAEPLNFFLDTVWNAQSEADLLKGGNELAEFINSFESPAAVLGYEARLLKMVKQVPDFPEKQDAAFLNELVQLGGTYAGLDPVNAAGEDEGTIEFFLDTLWRSDSEGSIGQGIGEFSSFIKDFNNPSQLLKFQKKLLTTLKKVPSRAIKLKNVSSVSKLLSEGRLFAAIKTDNVQVRDVSGFLSNIWAVKSERDLDIVAQNYQNFINESNQRYSLNSGNLIAQEALGWTDWLNPFSLFTIVIVGGLVIIYQAGVKVYEGGLALSDWILQRIFPVEEQPIQPSNAPNTNNAPHGIPTPSIENPRNPDEAIEARSRELENEAAKTLSQGGYDVEQNPAQKENGKNPDYKIEGEYADCYAPRSSADVDRVHSKIREKVNDEQADIIVVNAEDAPNVNTEDLAEKLDEIPIPGLKQVFIVRGGKIEGIIIPSSQH